jgi:hypothetical protein
MNVSKMLLCAVSAVAMLASTPAFADPEVQITPIEGSDSYFRTYQSQYSAWNGSVQTVVIVELCDAGGRCVRQEPDIMQTNGLFDGMFAGAVGDAVRRPTRVNNTTSVNQSGGGASASAASESNPTVTAAAASNQTQGQLQGQTSTSDASSYSDADTTSVIAVDTDVSQNTDLTNVIAVDTDVSQNVNVDGSSGGDTGGGGNDSGNCGVNGGDGNGGGNTCND